MDTTISKYFKGENQLFMYMEGETKLNFIIFGRGFSPLSQPHQFHYIWENKYIIYKICIVNIIQIARSFRSKGIEGLLF